MVAKMVPMRTRVLIAFVSSGRRKLGTPLATASLPVKPTEPDANARRTSSSVSGVVPSDGNGFGGGTGAGGAPGRITVGRAKRTAIALGRVSGRAGGRAGGSPRVVSWVAYGEEELLRDARIGRPVAPPALSPPSPPVAGRLPKGRRGGASSPLP